MGLYFTPNYLLLTAAVITTVVGVIGLYKTSCGTNEQVFRAFMFVLTVILAMETTSAIVAHIHKSILSEGRLKAEMLKTFALFTDPLVKECVSETQEKFHCCGVNNYADWLSNNFSNNQFPESCFCDKKARCVIYPTQISNVSIYKSSCYNRVLDKINSQLSVFQVIGPVLAALQLLLFCLVMYIVTRIQNSSIVGAYIVNYGGGSQENSESSLSVSQSSMSKSGCCNVVQEESSHM